MNQKKVLINTVVAILLVGAVVAGYIYLSGGDKEAERIGLDSVVGEETPVVPGGTSEFLLLLESLKGVDLSGQIFTNDLFSRELVNFTTIVPFRPQGRANPFAPLGTANLSSQAPDSEQGTTTVSSFLNEETPVVDFSTDVQF